MIEANTTRWTVTVSKDTDIAVRSLLAQRGLKKGDLSKFIEDAVRWRVFDQTLSDARAEFADLATAEFGIMDAPWTRAAPLVRALPSSAERAATNGERASGLRTGAARWGQGPAARPACFPPRKPLASAGMDAIASPHDAFFLGRREIAQDFPRHQLPAGLLAALDLDSLKVSTGALIERKFGTPSVAVRQRVAAADADTLRDWSELNLTADRLDALMTRIEPPRRHPNALAHRQT